MFRLGQTLARIGTGLSSLAMLAWLLWPAEIASLNPEPFFAFAVAMVVWVATEFKLSEEIELRNSSPNDIRLAQKFVSLHRENLRTFLKDHDLFSFINYEYLSIVHDLVNEFDTQKIEFQNRNLMRPLETFVSSLKKFQNFMAVNTTPIVSGDKDLVGFKPTETVSQESYDWRKELSVEANTLASKAWDDFDLLVKEMKMQIPECLDN